MGLWPATNCNSKTTSFKPRPTAMSLTSFKLRSMMCFQNFIYTFFYSLGQAYKDEHWQAIDTSLVLITRPSFCRPQICFCSLRLCSCSWPIFSISWQMCSRYPSPEPSGLDWLAWFTWLSRQRQREKSLRLTTHFIPLFIKQCKNGGCKHIHAGWERDCSLR